MVPFAFHNSWVLRVRPIIRAYFGVFFSTCFSARIIFGVIAVFGRFFGGVAFGWSDFRKHFTTSGPHC
jgi:hypothetical protein